MSRILLSRRGPGQYGVVGSFLDELAAAFRELGSKVMEVPIGDEERFRRALRKGPDLVLGVSVLPSIDTGDIPTVRWLIDHLLYYRFGTERHRLACVDRTHMEGLEGAFFLPHAGSMVEGPPLLRECDLLFSGGFIDPEGLQGAPVCSFELADRLVRNVRRRDLLQVLEGAGMPVDVWGMGWHLYPSQGVHHFHGPAPWPAILDQYRRSKVVLHVGPNFECGSHERVFSAMLSGAAVVLDRNPYWEEIFVDGEDCLMYDWESLDQVPDLVADLLADEGRREAMAASARSKVVAGHTWRHRAEQLSRSWSI